MDSRNDTSVYISPVPFPSDPVRAVAVYCSDGRFGSHFEDFLSRALKLPLYDRLAAPGGAACLAGHIRFQHQERSLDEQLRFLIEAHAIRHVVLIAHQDCGFYIKGLRLPPSQVESQQQEDVQTAAERIRTFASDLRVDIYYARKCTDGAIRFQSLEQWLDASLANQ